MTNKELFKQMLDKKEKPKTIPKDYTKRIQALLEKYIEKIRTIEYLYPPHYKNSKDVIKELNISSHALKKFIFRLQKVYEKDVGDLSPEKFKQLLCLLVNNSTRENLNKSSTLKNRRLKHTEGNDSIYLKLGCFRFICCNMQIVTVEIRGYYNYLN